jgi:hypothetical protein
MAIRAAMAGRRDHCPVEEAAGTRVVECAPARRGITTCCLAPPLKTIANYCFLDADFLWVLAFVQYTLGRQTEHCNICCRESDENIDAKKFHW